MSQQHPEVGQILLKQEQHNDNHHHQLQKPIALFKSEVDGTEEEGEQVDEEEDLLSFWSDSAASNCDRLASPSAHGFTTPTTTIAQSQSQSKSAIIQDCNQDQTTKGGDGASGGPPLSVSLSSKRCCNTNQFNNNGGRNVRKRVMANERERERTKSLNQALEILRNRLPVPEAEKRSKIQTLRMAKEYIEFLAKFKRLSQQQQQQQQQQQINDNPSSTTTPDQSSRQQISNHYGTKSLLSDDGLQETIAQNQQQQQQPQPDSPLTYKFYKFRLKSQTTRND